MNIYNIEYLFITHYSIPKMKETSKDATFVLQGFLCREKHSYRAPLMVILVTSGFLLNQIPFAAWCLTVSTSV